MTEEEVPKITSVVKIPKQKNPGQVAAGKRLAAISKEAKEKKRLERENVIKESCNNNDNSDTTAILVGGLIVAGVAALYFQKFHNTGNEGTEGTEEREPKVRKVCETPKEPKEPREPRNSSENKYPTDFKIYKVYPPKNKSLHMYSMDD